MSRYNGPRCRITRRLGILPGFTKKESKKKTLPGQHGLLPTRKKSSQYGIRLLEKQKLRFNYGVTEKQLRNLAAQAKKTPGSTGSNLLSFLEMRLDNLVFRLGFRPTVVSARQLVTHGHVSVNGNKITVPNYQCKAQDVITINSKAHHLISKIAFGENAVPTHLSRLDDSTGRINKVVDRQAIGLTNLDDLLVVEYYSNRI